MAKPYRKTEPRPDLVQAKLVYVELLNRRLHERVEWIPRNIKAGAIVQVDGDTRYWTVKEIYNQAV